MTGTTVECREAVRTATINDKHISVALETVTVGTLTTFARCRHSINNVQIVDVSSTKYITVSCVPSTMLPCSACFYAGELYNLMLNRCFSYT